jgi:hypothetical protein
MTRILRFSLFALLLLTACGSKPDLKPGSMLLLTSFTENSVTVAIDLVIDADGQAWLSATFTPSDPLFHVYSMDIPRDGVDGLGRPTLLELGPDSQMTATGPLTASVAATDSDIDDLPTYPPGPVTLSLPVILPPGDGWVEDSVSLTYMACGSYVCLPPVIGEVVSVRVPGADAIQNP